MENLPIRLHLTSN